MVASWACDVTGILTQRRKPLLCGDKSDLTSPTGNNIPDIDITVSVV